MKSVLVIGGGLAGLAAASSLAQRGFRVTILESRNRLGGRASSFTDVNTGQVIDACQHVSMGCCSQFAHFCRTVGIDHLLSREKCLWFMTPDRRVSRFAGDSWLPAPLHLARSLLRAHYLTLADKIRISFGMLRLMFCDPSDDQPLLPWLKRNRQNRHTIDRFWSVVLVSALNEQIDRLGLKYARKVFFDGFLRDRHGYEVYVPTVPLASFYGLELQQWFEKHSVSIELNAAVTHLEFADGRVDRARLRDGRCIHADWYLAAVPFDRLFDILPSEAVESMDKLSRARKLEVAPITSVHLWFDRPVTELPHIVLVDCLGHWVFNRGKTAACEHYLQVVISAAHTLAALGREEIQRQVIEELRRLFPGVAAATLVRARIVTERRATFSPVPGVDDLRPGQSTTVPNLVLAGDWTTTGWPATMEGAVRSGYLAAEAIAAAR